MTISIQFNSPEDLKLLEPFLSQFRNAGVNIQILPAKPPAKLRKKRIAGLAEKLHGVLRLPADFDHRSFLADEFLKKHTPNG